MNRVFLCLVCGIVVALSACQTIAPPSPPARNISELFENMYVPNLEYDYPAMPPTPLGYSVGLFYLQVRETLPQGFEREPGKNFLTEGLEPFVMSYYKGLERLFISKGITVRGPFKNREEMTFPDRKESSYVIVPFLDINIMIEKIPPQRLDEYSQNPPAKPRGGMSWVEYTKNGYRFVYQCKFRYEIWEPVSNQKLEIHEVTSEPFTYTVDAITRIAYSQVEESGVFSTDMKKVILTSKNTTGYYNWENAGYRLTESLFKNLIPKTNEYFSGGELEHLKKYAEELRSKTVYSGN